MGSPRATHRVPTLALLALALLALPPGAGCAGTRRPQVAERMVEGLSGPERVAIQAAEQAAVAARAEAKRLEAELGPAERALGEADEEVAQAEGNRSRSRSAEAAARKAGDLIGVNDANRVGYYANLARTVGLARVAYERARVDALRAARLAALGREAAALALRELEKARALEAKGMRLDTADREELTLYEYQRRLDAAEHDRRAAGRRKRIDELKRRWDEAVARRRAIAGR